MPLYVEKRPSGIYRIRGSHHGVTIDRSARTRKPGEADKVREKVEREIFEQVVLGKAEVGSSILPGSTSIPACFGLF